MTATTSNDDDNNNDQDNDNTGCLPTSATLIVVSHAPQITLSTQPQMKTNIMESCELRSSIHDEQENSGTYSSRMNDDDCNIFIDVLMRLPPYHVNEIQHEGHMITHFDCIVSTALLQHII